MDHSDELISKIWRMIIILRWTRKKLKNNWFSTAFRKQKWIKFWLDKNSQSGVLWCNRGRFTENYINNYFICVSKGFSSVINPDFVSINKVEKNLSRINILPFFFSEYKLQAGALWSEKKYVVLPWTSNIFDRGPIIKVLVAAIQCKHIESWRELLQSICLGV